MGLSGPLMKAGRNYDCFSKFYNWGLGNIATNKWFDKGFKVDDYANWINMGILAFFFPLETYETGKQCYYELQENKKYMEENEGPWDDEDTNDLENWKADMPIVQGGDESKGGKIFKGIVYVLALGAYGWNIYKAYKSQYYYWMFGFYIGKAATTTVSAIGFFAGIKIIPSQHVRYVESQAYDF